MKQIICFLTMLITLCSFVPIEYSESDLYVLYKVKETDVNNEEHDTERECWLQLFHDGKYLIELYGMITEDMIEFSLLSYGDYSWKNDSLYLVDNYNKYSILLVSMDGKLHVMKGFPFMTYNDFIFKEQLYADYPDTTRFCKWPSFDELNDSINCDNSNYSLDYKTYSWGDNTITIKENGNYSITLSGFLISEGSWERKNNLLIMKDDYMECNHYAIIADEALIGYLIDAEPIIVTYR